MGLSRQDKSLISAGRTNQKARTRTALLNAAAELVREGRPPSIPEAAGRAFISVATAYRYFGSAEDLWWEATTAAVEYQPTMTEADKRIEAAGTAPAARLEALIRSVGFHMLDDQLVYRQMAKTALEQWFRQANAPYDRRVPVRGGRRNEQITKVLAPLNGRLPKKTLDHIAHALGLIIGTDAMIALTDGVGLDPPAAKRALLDAGRWLLAGALAELGDKIAQRKDG